MDLTERDLPDHGWLQRPSGRWVHPTFAAVPGSDRRRPFTTDEALTLTAAVVRERDESLPLCPWCLTRHEQDPEPAEVDA